MAIQIDSGACTRCGACVRDCIVEILRPGADGVPVVAPGLERFCLNCQHCLAVCPEGAVTCHGVPPSACFSTGVLPEAESMLHLLRTRRSIRHYKAENLDRATLEKLKDSMRWTPTGCNDHRLFFSIVEEREEMEFFRTRMSKLLKFLIRSGILRLIYPNYKRYLGEILSGKDVVFRGAPHMIVAATPKDAPCGEADPWISLTGFDLFAQSLGVGTCWCGFALYAFRWNRGLRKGLHLPPGYKPGAVMLFGKPDISYARTTAPAQFKIHVLRGSGKIEKMED